LKILFYDFEKEDISLIENYIIKEETKNINKIKSFLNSSGNMNIIEEDIKKLSNLVLKSHISSLNALDAVYIALKKIGRPAHYNEISEMCNALFKDRNYTPRNVNSYLSREPELSNNKLPWVWLGVRGVYALKEWGYERPDLGIHETVVEIVRKNYLKTKRPVSFQKILSEIGKYRKIYKKTSLTIACGCNPKLSLVGRDSYIPIEYNKVKKVEKSSVDLDNLDRILKHFDN